MRLLKLQGQEFPLTPDAKAISNSAFAAGIELRAGTIGESTTLKEVGSSLCYGSADSHCGARLPRKCGQDLR